MNATKKLLVVLALALVACEARNKSSIVVLGRAAPSSDTDCTFAAGGEFQLGSGVLDVSFPNNSYEIPLYVNNELAAPSSSSTATVDSSKAWRAEVARVRVNPGTYVNDYRPSPPLLPNTAQNTVPLDGKTIEVGGEDVVWVEAMSTALVQSVAGAVPAGGQGTIVLGITIQGHTLDGEFLDTAEFYYAVRVCDGCLQVPAACVAPAVPVTLGCFGEGQDFGQVCAVPAP